MLSFAHTGNSLTLKNIDQMLTEVLDWHTLGIKLGIPDHSLWKIQINYSTYGVGRQRQEMISNWLKNDTETSWSKLASVLKEMGCNMVAAKIWNQCVLGYRGVCVCVWGGGGGGGNIWVLRSGSGSTSVWKCIKARGPGVMLP